MTYVASLAVAEEVVQETWISLLQSLDRFEGRCSLKTWIFRILTNRAKARGVREARSVPFSALQRLDDDADTPAVDPTAFDQPPAMDHDFADGKTYRKNACWPRKPARIFSRQSWGCHPPSAP